MPQAALRKIDCHVHLIGDGGSGSDFPVAVSGFGPWRLGLISRETWRQSRHQPNALQRDVFLKHAIGFDNLHLTSPAWIVC